MSYLNISGVSKKYNDGPMALSSVSLSLAKGEVLSMIGESGSGKSTLLRIIAGLEVQDEGEVTLGELKILNPDQKLVSGYDEIKLIHQENRLYPNSTVEENIKRPLLPYDKAYRKERLEEVMSLLNLRAFRDKLPKQLSGGQQQKVAIARALAIEPEVLLLDEPFSSLDTIQKRELIEELRSIFEALQMTVIFVTHDLDDALMMSGRLCILQQGKLIQKGTAREVFRKPVNIYSAKLFSHINPLPDNSGKFIRPSDLQLFKSKGLKGLVTNKQYLVHYNLLAVELNDGTVWKVEDKKRAYEAGEKVFLKWEREKEITFLKN